jgi:hypothetical protein
MKIELRRTQIKNKQGNNIVVQCTSAVPYTLTYVAGNTPQNWIDVTENTEGLEQLSISYVDNLTDNNSSGESGVGDLTFVGAAAELIRDHLFSTPCAYFNSFDVRITDHFGNVYENYLIKADNIQDCDTDLCELKIPLRETDWLKKKLLSIPIFDNWQGWFDGTNKRQFRSSRVIVHNNAVSHAMPVGLLIFLKAFGSLGGFGLGSIVFAVIDGDVLTDTALGFSNFGAIIPVSDILDNGLKRVNPNMTIQTPFHNGDYRAVHVFAAYNGDYYRIENVCVGNAQSSEFLFNNRHAENIYEFIVELCRTFNFEWELVGDTFVMTYAEAKILQPSIGSIGSDEVVSMCKNFTLNKQKASGIYGYEIDYSDTGSQNASIMYNDNVDFDGDGLNEMAQGKLEKKSKMFAPTDFYGSGLGSNKLGDILD